MQDLFGGGVRQSIAKEALTLCGGSLPSARNTAAEDRIGPVLARVSRLQEHVHEEPGNAVVMLDLAGAYLHLRLCQGVAALVTNGVGSIGFDTSQSLSFGAGKSGIGKAKMVSKSCPPGTVKAVVLLRGQRSQEHRGNAIEAQHRLGGEIGIRARAKPLGKAPPPAESGHGGRQL